MALLKNESALVKALSTPDLYRACFRRLHTDLRHYLCSQAITTLGFKQPTPIQKACIPVGLLGKDLCACAATGTGMLRLANEGNGLEMISGLPVDLDFLLIF